MLCIGYEEQELFEQVRTLILSAVCLQNVWKLENLKSLLIIENYVKINFT